MIQRRPAYSSAFTPDALRQVPVVLPDDITTDWAWGGSTGAGVKVAVIDSGIESGHPGVPGAAVAGYVAISEDAGGKLQFDTSPHGDLFGHGTACAGIIRQTAPECELYSVRVLGSTLGGKGSIFSAGLRWAIENGMQVCNLSLGTTRKDFFGVLHELADLAYFKSVMLVCAANNVPIPSFPSVYGSVISVAAHDRSEPDIFYYNPEPPVEFGAQGIGVRAPWLNGGWLTVTGNSFAAPHITGVVTRIVSKHPDISVFQVKTVLRALAANSMHATGATQSGEQPATAGAASP
ncbi:MAG TPA: S8 family serine peptidase [Chloroflexota bacterium]|nr:S8 family serine peptidase [Chloroflexota bacterium]